ncbi:MAG: hypothetical protein KDB53_11590, partial [Planctomycetes bacterium]|nr:hypothetical protein [Planctomycetota bacterium]
MNSSLLRCVVLGSLLAIATGCGGGSSGGGGGGGGFSQVMEITVLGVGAPIYTNGQAPQPVCPQGAFLNAAVRIKFDGPVDVASLPPSGQAQGGSIQVVDVLTDNAALGVFSIDPVDPSVVNFFGQAPGDPTQGCSAGFTPNAVYSVFVPDQTSGLAQVITVAGRPIGQGITTCFGVRSCGNMGDVPFTDQKPN